MNNLVLFQSLLEIHGLASLHSDPNLCDFLDSEYLQEQVDGIKELSDHITNLNRVGEGLGVYMFDKNLSEGNAQKFKIRLQVLESINYQS